MISSRGLGIGKETWRIARLDSESGLMSQEIQKVTVLANS